jgi:ABC-type spermidine/putrescine transport system permease subunit II
MSFNSHTTNTQVCEQTLQWYQNIMKGKKELM